MLTAVLAVLTWLLAARGFHYSKACQRKDCEAQDSRLLRTPAKHSRRQSRSQRRPLLTACWDPLRASSATCSTRTGVQRDTKSVWRDATAVSVSAQPRPVGQKPGAQHSLISTSAARPPANPPYMTLLNLHRRIRGVSCGQRELVCLSTTAADTHERSSSLSHFSSR